MNDRLEIKAALSVSDAGEITGLAWPFGSADKVGDIIEKGAFNSPIKLPMLFAHDQKDAVGVWNSIEETAAGLVVKGRLLIDDVARAREVRALVQAGAVTGLSIGFVTKKAATRRGGGRTISALDLHEISIVPVPSHPGARIVTAKAAGAATTPESQMAKENEAAAPDLAALETKMGELADTVKGVAKMTERLDRVEAALNRPGAVEVKADNDNKIEAKAFNSLIRKGIERCAPEEIKALTVATDATAGYLAPDSFANEIIKALRVYSPIRQYARVTSVSASAVKFPRRTGTTNAAWVDETDDRTESEPSYEQITLTPFELATYTDVSNALLEDNSYNLEGELSNDFAEDFGVKEGFAFVKGDGTTQPKGVMTETGITEVITGAAADFVTPTASVNPADCLIDMYHTIPGVHASNAVWLMNRLTLAKVRKFKDAQGRYLVVDPVSAGAPVTLLGRPIVEAPDMDNVGANAHPILFGDLQGYRIIDRISLSVLRDPFSLATKGQVRFHARRRVGGGLTHKDRFVKLKVAAS